MAPMRVSKYACAVSLVVSLVMGCGDRDPDDSDAPDATATFASIAVEPPTATLSVPIGTTVTQAYQAFGVAADGTRTELTASCSFNIDTGFGSFTAATATVGPRGGKAAINAICGTQTGQAQLIVNLTGTFIQGGAPASSEELFATATLGTDPARVPAIEYPIEGAVSPRNIPSIEAQWQAAANDLFHVSLTSSYASVHVYTTAVESVLEAAAWASLAGTAAGEQLIFVVEGLAQAAPSEKFASTPVKIVMTHDDIDQTAIYYWASSQGNIMSQVFGSPEEPSLVKDQCTSCHSVSRSGDRVGYSRCVAGNCSSDTLAVGFLKYDAATASWVESVNADNLAILGSYTTFNPDGSIAMVNRRGGTFGLYDPDTGAEIPSNLAVANIGGTASAMMPDWSADGGRVVYVSANPNAYIDLSGGSIHSMTYSNAGGTHTFGDPVALLQPPLTLANGEYTNFFFPSFSPDGALVVANATRTYWRFGNAKQSGARLVLAESTGAWTVDLTQLNGGSVDANITWAHWAPTVSAEYYWVVFSSERDYGHRTTIGTSPASCKQNGVEQCKQIWLSAIRKDRLGAGQDPSAPPMWLPGQNPLANNISPYWSKPAVLQ